MQHETLPVPVTKGDSLCIKITQHAYELNLADSEWKLHGWLVLNKGDKRYTTKEVSLKLSKIWKISHPWHLKSPGKGFSKFSFGSIEDLRLVWSQGTVNMKPGLVRLMKSTNDFNTHSQFESVIKINLRVSKTNSCTSLDMNDGLPQEYWNNQTILEIDGAIGTPLPIE